jgi:hypothetical protein
MNERGTYMMQIEFDKTSGRWVGFIDDKAVFSSTSKYYVKQKLQRMSPKFVEAAKPSEFSINERFDFVGKIVKMVASKTTASAIISGSGGMGKTFSVLSALKDAGMKDITDLASFEVGAGIDVKRSFRVLKGYTTAKGLFRTLQECKDLTLVLDDFDSALKDPVSLNLLKAALDGYSKRYITWNSDFKDDDLDRTFEFKGSIVFITNIPSEKIDQAVRSRCMTVDVSMNQAEMLERMSAIIESDSFLPEVSIEHKRTALEFIGENVKDIVNLSLRTLIQIAKVVSGDPKNYKSLSRYLLTQGN